MPVDWPRGLMTLDEFIALPESEARFELAEGVLVMSPRPMSGHQRIVKRLATALDAALPREFESILDCEVVLLSQPLATVRVPDVIVTPVMASVPRFEPSDVLLAVEVISPGSRNIDRLLKRYEYAEGGIAHYWIVDLDGPGGPEITVLELEAPNESYTQVQVATGELVVERPFPMRIDLAALVAPRA